MGCRRSDRSATRFSTSIGGGAASRFNPRLRIGRDLMDTAQNDVLITCLFTFTGLPCTRAPFAKDPLIIKTAMGLEVPDKLLALADEVIE